MFLTRALTVLIALPVFAAALILLPQAVWALFLIPGLLIGAWEWGRLSGYGGAARLYYAAAVGLVSLAIAFLAPQPDGSAVRLDVWLYAVSLAFWVAVAPLWLAGRWSVRNPFVLGVAGCVVLIPMWLALVRLQATPWVLLLFLSIVWIADTAAYLAGRTWGRRKLAPRISPGKSWEGVLGAALALGLYYALLWFIVPAGDRAFSAGPGMLVFAAILALSIEGDLFESWMKRQSGLKDSGNLLPGHGGILDRIDGLTSTLPAAALAVYLL